MVKRQIQLLDIASVAAGGTAVIECPIGPRYHDITFVFGNTAAANANAPTVASCIGEIRALLNGREQRKVTGVRLDAINTDMGSDYASQAYAGVANGSGRRHLTMYFGEPWRKRLLDQDGLAWQTGYLGANGTFTIQVDIASGITPSLTAFATVDDFNGGKPHAIMKWNTAEPAFNGTQLEYNRLPRRDLIAQITAFNSVDNDKAVSAARLVVGGVEVHKRTYNENATFIKSRGMTVTAGRYHVVMDHDDYLEDCLPPANDMTLTLDLAASDNSRLPIITQLLGLPD